MFNLISLFQLVSQAGAFRVVSNPLKRTSRTLNMISAMDVPVMVSNFLTTTLQVSDTSISEEEVLAVAGQVTDLPSPIYAVIFAVVIFAGVAGLQFSLGDLTKQEGQARVRDFLQTRKDTERKRGYFD
eukprot:gene9112-18880_t